MEPGALDALIAAGGLRSRDGMHTLTNTHTSFAHLKIADTHWVTHTGVITAGDLIIVTDSRLDDRTNLTKTLAIDPTSADPHIIAAAYAKWGQTFATHLTGDYAIAIYNTVVESSLPLQANLDRLADGPDATVHWRLADPTEVWRAEPAVFESDLQVEGQPALRVHEYSGADKEGWLSSKECCVIWATRTTPSRSARILLNECLRTTSHHQSSLIVSCPYWSHSSSNLFSLIADGDRQTLLTVQEPSGQRDRVTSAQLRKSGESPALSRNGDAPWWG